MKVKTYGINGLSEWQGDVKAGAISVKVAFTGGTVSPSGAQPAYFVTKDPITQFVIENSKEYKEGFIHLEMQQEMPGDHPRMAVAKVVEPAPVVEETTTMEPENNVVEEDASETAETDASDNVIKVATKSDAIEWLKEHYPEKEYTAVKLRSKAAFDAACEECGVVFEIAE